MSEILVIPPTCPTVQDLINTITKLYQEGYIHHDSPVLIGDDKKSYSLVACGALGAPEGRCFVLVPSDIAIEKLTLVEGNDAVQ